VALHHPGDGSCPKIEPFEGKMEVLLVAQAEIAFERWTGVAGAGPIMRAALIAEL
jgi:hypothetical protein